MNFTHVAYLVETGDYVELMAYLDGRSKEDLAQLLVMLEIGAKAARIALGAKL